MRIHCIIFVCFVVLLRAKGQMPDKVVACGSLPVTNIEEYTKIPWTAKIYLRDEKTTDKTFAALILSPHIVITYANSLRSAGANKKLQIFPLENYSVVSNTSKFSENTVDNKFVQTSRITHIRIPPDYNAGNSWTKIENNIAIFHLATPIQFDSQVHAVCVPKHDQIEQYIPLDTNSTVLLSGWKRHADDAVVLRMTAVDNETCSMWWHTDERVSQETLGAPYNNRYCLNVSQDNTHIKCINIDVGTYVVQENISYFIGFVNNFFSDNRTCTSKARFFISEITASILKFIENNTRCGPHQFTCTNGDCISLNNTVCNQKSDCSDSSDEDPNFCRGLNYCDSTQFPCGVYGKCITETQRCDGNVDCEAGEDENEITCPRPVEATTSNSRETHTSDTLSIALAVSLLGIVALLVAAIIFWRKMKLAQKQLRELTDEEVAEFEHGIATTGEFRKSAVEHNYSNAPSKKDYQQDTFAWDKFRYEIPKDKLKIDWNAVLGSGVAGVVYNGNFLDHTSSGNPETKVAVKTFKSSADVENLKSLLSELKIMTKVGNHENIVNLVGAYTREIKQRVLYMALELCHMGSLDKYLIHNRDCFVHLIDMGGNVRDDLYPRLYENLTSQQQFTTLVLIRWSHQIANGMEHLASQNVTHGDLATRNILLTSDCTAKISDFGLSRNLYASGLYFKKNMAPLPWRWMAIESLRDFEFSVKSDVWAYGVTLWEIFSLGGVPYPGLNWTQDFIVDLNNGLRLNTPAYASDQIYNMMRNCWECKSIVRPDFTDLKNYFHRLHVVLEQRMMQEATTIV